MNKSTLSLFGSLLLLLIALFLTGCAGPRIQPLMNTPVLYSSFNVGPLDNIPDKERWSARRVYYVTTRERNTDLQRIDYTNGEAELVSVGMSLIGFGQPALPWDKLNTYSKLEERPEPVDLAISGLIEVGKYDEDEAGNIQDDWGAASWLMRDINQSISAARDKDLMIYVHGAKVNFYNANAFAAQLDHFMGRDMTSMAFSWPTRQNILMYGSGMDMKRGYRSAPKLATLLEMLARETTARRIHIVCWSAGGRVVNDAMRILHERHSGEGVDLRKKLRIGTVYFAAADVPGDEFLEVLPAMNEIVQRVAVTVSSKDGALLLSQRVMSGKGSRIGLRRTDLTEEQQAVVAAADRLEVIDVSRNWEGRGFDITGHRYWFDHPWASTDMILAVRSDLDPADRALGATKMELLWYIPEDYPERLKQSLTRAGLQFRRND